jgi:glycine/D-amino acid oxidase-like deaminating enzyme
MSSLALPPTRQTLFGGSRAEQVVTDNKIPAHSDVVIIGGGIIGLMTAWHLARRGLQVAVCEKGEVAGEASGRAFGWASGLLLDPCKMELTRASLESWDEAQSLLGETGYRVNGLCYLAENDEEMGYFEAWRDQVKGSGYDGIEMLDSAGIRQLFPGANRAWSGGICARHDGSIEPKLAAPAAARGVIRAGGRVLQHCAVRSLDTRNGAVCGVVTEHGPISCSTVLLAAGIWTRLFCGNHRIDVPQLYFLMTMGCTTAAPAGPVGSGGQEAWAWRRQVDGAYSLGRLRGQRVPITRDSIQLFSKFAPMLKAEARNTSLTFGRDTLRDWSWSRRWRPDEATIFERVRIYEPSIDSAVPESSLRLNGENFAALRAARLAEAWAGAITVTPDNEPIAGPVEQLRGLYLVTGTSYGMTWAPTIGCMMADLMTGKTPRLDPTRYRLGRFYDGSPITVKI